MKNNKFEKHFKTAQSMQRFAERLAGVVGSEGLQLWLLGPLGAGKTTFAQGFLRGAGFQGRVKSPTYTLVEPYETPLGVVYHLDLYRLQGPSDLHAMGIEDYFAPDAKMLIEWPEKGQGILPPPDLFCHVMIVEGGRLFQMEAMSQRGETIMAAICK